MGDSMKVTKNHYLYIRDNNSFHFRGLFYKVNTDIKNLA